MVNDKDDKQNANAFEIESDLRIFRDVIEASHADALSEVAAYIKGDRHANRTVHLAYAFSDALRTFADAIDSAAAGTEATAKANGTWRK